ncbi:MAG TPA: DNRLRE domain-containing protein, partial [Phycisphaerae bacterium]|nr:DNRLRE domain-containing protein [Phycisphaerae bacterium]
MLRAKAVACATVVGFLLMAGAAHGWDVVPNGRLNEVMVDDFESGVLYELATNPKPDGFGWQTTTYAGDYTWQIDNSFGADGSGKSMKITMQTTVPYFYYLHSGRDKYILDGYEKPTNRMEFWVKFPQDWMREWYLLHHGDYIYGNFDVGTYQRDPSITLAGSSATETWGWHFYYQLLFNMYDANWTRVVLGKSPQHKRALHINPGFNPTQPQGDMFKHWTRVYFTGNPYAEPAGPAYPHDIWFDQWSYYYENDYMTCNPEYASGEGTAGASVEYPIVVTNTHPTETREFGLYKSSELYNAADYWTHDARLYLDEDADGVHDAGETTEPTNTGTLAPLTKWYGVLVVNIPASGTGSETGAYVVTALQVYQTSPAYPLDPHLACPRYLDGGVPTDYTAQEIGPLRGIPTVGAQITTTTVASVTSDTTAPSALSDLTMLAVGDRDAQLRWTATGDDGQAGVPYAYEARYSTSPISPANWTDAMELVGEPDAFPQGTVETWWVPPVLDAGTTYYLAIKVLDEKANASAISNVVSFTTTNTAVGNQAPTASAGATPSTGSTPLGVGFSSAGSVDSDGQIVLYVWDFGDGAVSNETNPSHTYNLVGTHTVTLTVFDDGGDSASDQVTVTATRGASGKIMLRQGSQGYTSGFANRIREGGPNDVILGAYYGNPNVLIGEYAGPTRGLFQFAGVDAALALPQGSTVTDAQLILYQQTNTVAGPVDIEVYDPGQPYTPQQATWNSASTGVPWATPGAIPSGASPLAVLSTDRHALTYRSVDVTSWVAAGQDVGVTVRIPQEASSGYIYIGTHDDPVAQHRPTLLVTYSGGGNVAPTVDAGPDDSVTLPTDTVNLNGTVSDDGLPDPPAAVTTAWTKFSGPGTVTFGNANAVDTTATFSTDGVYVLQLEADDSELQTTDTVQITVNPAATNQAPTVDAGSNQSITLPTDTANLDGTVSDDGLPDPPATVTTTWTKFSGPGTVTFGNANAVDTTATFSTDGVYVLQLEADDSALQTTDTVQITVNPAGGVLSVGPGQTYATVDEAVNVASNGDTIEIHSATYTGNECISLIDKSGLTLRGVGPTRPILDAGGLSIQGKGIWVVTGSDTTVESIEFRNCSVPDHNGAGIRQEGANLTIRDCYFHHNEDGILVGGGTGSTVLIEYCEFAYNGYGGGFTHNMYIGNVGQFTLRHCYVHHAYQGQEVKSRALVSYIEYNRITNEDGEGNYEVDLSNGGTTYIIGNMIHQGDYTSNSGIITYAAEGATNPDQHLYVVNNTIVNRKGVGTFVYNASTTDCLLHNNIFEGTGVVLDGPGVQIDNWVTSNAYLVDRANYDFHLTANSTGAIDQGSDPGYGQGYSLTPVLQYVHPTNYESRPVDAPIDIGAFEFTGTPANQAPTVDAGPNDSITLPTDTVNLDGTVGDDGLPDPPAVVTTTWTKFSGPGTVTFGNANAVDTTATFSTDGVYVLQLEADDSELQTTDTVQITVNPAAGETTIVFQNGVEPDGSYAGCDDTWIDLYAPTTNYGDVDWGNGVGYYADVKRSLIQFDTSQIPTDATVTSAKLELMISKAATTLTVEAFEVYQPWTLMGATWNDYDTGSAWGTAGCASVGVDRSGTVSGSVEIVPADVGLWKQIDLSATLIQSWVSSPASNKGILLKATNEASNEIRYRAENYTTLAERPKLTVTYTTGAPVPTVAFDATSSNGAESVSPANLSVSLSASSRSTVTVDYSVTGGTATGGGVDYTLAAGTLTFDPNDLSETVAITIVNDGLVESDETIQVTLSNPSNATLGANTVHTYTINDNDALPSVEFDLISSSGDESLTPA